MKLNIFRKFKLFLFYRKTIKNINEELLSNYNLRIDRSNRMYTILNIPEELIEEPYNLRKQDIDTIASSFIKEYTKELSEFLDTKGLKELYSFYRVEKVEKYSYLLVYGFSLFKSHKFILNIYKSLGIIIILSILIFFLFKLFAH